MGSSSSLSWSLTLTKTVPGGGQALAGGQLGAGEGLAEVAADAHHLAGALHLRAEQVIGAREAAEGEDRSLDEDAVRPAGLRALPAPPG